MLCAGVVHGDLSEFSILLAHMPGVDEPVIIALAACTGAKKDADWPSYLGDDARTHFSRLDAINTSSSNGCAAW